MVATASIGISVVTGPSEWKIRLARSPGSQKMSILVKMPKWSKWHFCGFSDFGSKNLLLLTAKGQKSGFYMIVLAEFGF